MRAKYKKNLFFFIPKPQPIFMFDVNKDSQSSFFSIVLFLHLRLLYIQSLRTYIILSSTPNFLGNKARKDSVIQNFALSLQLNYIKV